MKHQSPFVNGYKCMAYGNITNNNEIPRNTTVATSIATQTNKITIRKKIAMNTRNQQKNYTDVQLNIASTCIAITTLIHHVLMIRRAIHSTALFFNIIFHIRILLISLSLFTLWSMDKAHVQHRITEEWKIERYGQGWS